ncbi:hypothetical protein DPMN_150638 [Dreissena polymorpha]|uniref:Uncharacterized protein n=1 Tax=Dreissena polymorpha TaxID=45954 RepID=A0A9D4FDT1_DREPO|nr:hypothetical protein DPMN_150638 [Dreissena polymorpha]
MNRCFAQQLNKDGDTWLTNSTRDGTFPTQLVPLMASTWTVKLLLTLAQNSTTTKAFTASSCLPWWMLTTSSPTLTSQAMAHPQTLRSSLKVISIVGWTRTGFTPFLSQTPTQ